MIFIVLLLSIPTHSLYSDPPLDNVSQHNLFVAQSLDDHFDSNNATNGTIQMDFYGTNIYWGPIHLQVNLSLISASMRLLTIDPSIDNAIGAAHDPVLIFSWGNQSLPFATQDIDHDDCPESQINSTVTRSAMVSFTYGNESRTVTTTSNTLPIPNDILLAMENSSGMDELRVNLNASFNFTYTIDDRRPSHEEGCSHHLMNFSTLLVLNESRNWTVEGNRTIFFLRSPVLGEQWFRNNRFDSLMFSSSRIYSGEISSDDNQTFYFRTNDFNITNDSYGIWHIRSETIPNQSSISENSALIQPVPLDLSNQSYHYIYEFNYSYDGLGWHALKVKSRGVFLDEYEFQRDILSRYLSYSGNLAETGVSSNETLARKSMAFQMDEMRNVTIALGLIGVLLVALLTNRYIGK